MERVVQGEAGTEFLIRLNPYRNPDGQAEGVVVSFIDLRKPSES